MKDLEIEEFDQIIDEIANMKNVNLDDISKKMLVHKSVVNEIYQIAFVQKSYFIQDQIKKILSSNLKSAQKLMIDLFRLYPGQH